MRHVMACCLALGLLANRATGQEVPEFTRERAKAVDELTGACIKAGGLALANTPDGKEKYPRVVDTRKLKATLAARKDTLTSDLRDGLTALWFRVEEPSQVAVVALLETFGEVKEDRHALGLATFFRAMSFQRSLQREEAVGAYLVASQHFESARQPLWQAASLNNLGAVQHSRGLYEEAVGYYKQALEMKRKLYSPDHSKDGHPDLAIILINLGGVHWSSGSYEEALGYYQQALEMQHKLYPPQLYI